MKVLIIGSSGFIGSALVNFYTGKEQTVFGADIFPVNRANYFQVTTESNAFDEIFSKHPFDICINASGLADVSRSVKEPLFDFKLNTYNVALILEAIRKYNPGCIFLQISSAAVYGNPAKLPVNENDAVAPLSPYGFNKLQSELLCKEYAQVYNLNTIVVRVFSAFGIGLKKQLFWDLYQKSKATNEIVLFGTGEESRDFIYIDDLVKAFDNIISAKSFNGSIYNVANGKEIKIKEAVTVFFSEMELQPQIIFNGEVRKGDPNNWRADISKLHSTGYRQATDFETGIRKYCTWVKENG